MQPFSKMLVLLLLGAVITAPLAAQGFRPDPASHERLAGCHEDAGNVPTPAPVSHSCCQVAHHPAILQQSSLRWLLQGSAPVVFSQYAAVVAAFNPFQNYLVVSGGPPVMSPLRV